ncbi:DEAD/DEAH box helicase family protein [Dehalococcoidia bacterium]|nr:DEAD/DEAH box helicase family protein [Dehalococcoidia bacterium]MCL0097580.1 DEAD/DEAH box helicase family protein [Dehalococcoidia bacterium]
MANTSWNLTTIPRRYQHEANEWALGRKQGVSCLPTGTGKTLVALLWLKHLFESGEIQKAIMLEPTRLLVNQTTEYLLQKAGIESVPIDGRIARDKRLELWSSAALVVATPETVLNDIEAVRADAVVIDECHHTVGQDAFAKVMVRLRPKWRLGLSAFIPSRRELEVSELIGPIKRWSWSDPEIVPYVPNWIGEIYEGHLNPEEQSLLKTIRQLPSGPGLNPALLERYLTRDGSVAVRETLTRKNCLARAFGDMLLPLVPDRMHKLEAVSDIFNSHDPNKAMVFVDRVVIADKVGELFVQMKPVVFKGKRGKFDQGAALQQARDRESRLVVSTSAGEEGIDLPSADLLVIWGNAASDTRFIQRLGRMMRKVGDGLKFATFVVTPESTDFDSFALGLNRAAEAGTIDVEKTFGWDPEVLWPRTMWWHISELLRGKPRSLVEMARVLDVREELAGKIVTNAVRRGRLFYIYDVEAIVREAEAEGEKWAEEYARGLFEDSIPEGYRPSNEWFRRAAWNTAIAILGKTRDFRVYALTDDVLALKESRPTLFSRYDMHLFLKPRLGSGRDLSYGWGGSVSAARELTPIARSLLNSGTATTGLALSRRKAERLEYFFRPQSEEVMRAVVENAARLFELIDLRRP